MVKWDLRREGGTKKRRSGEERRRLESNKAEIALIG
jgi:hypothetical protein